MSALDLVLLTLAVFAGVSAQRLTGLGFALVSAPLLTLILGTMTGVTLMQVLGIVVSAVILPSVWRDVEWRVLPWLLVPAWVGIVPGLLVVRSLPVAAMEVAIGVLVIVALVAVILSERARVFKGRRGAVAAGFLSGFMNATASVGGPAMVLYKVSRRWAQAPFVATIQVFFIAMSMVTVTARGWPDLAPTGWAVSLAAIVVGMVAGHRLAKVVPERVARNLTVGVALMGAVVIVIKGMMALLSGS
ncbi:MAG: TSUP family transporter [Propionibacteriaceae bacterium]|nr:TSUP family transporter [Propionibacteriaceae bacterium]